MARAVVVVPTGDCQRQHQVVMPALSGAEAGVTGVRHVGYLEVLKFAGELWNPIKPTFTVADSAGTAPVGNLSPSKPIPAETLQALKSVSDKTLATPWLWQLPTESTAATTRPTDA